MSDDIGARVEEAMAEYTRKAVADLAESMKHSSEQAKVHAAPRNGRNRPHRARQRTPCSPYYWRDPMRLVKRQELMTLPAGTLFAELLEPWSFGQLAIKGETMTDGGKNFDFLEIGLGTVDSDSTEQFLERLDEMLADSTVSYPAESDYGREGLYDDNLVYLVYEPADVEHLIGLLQGERP